VKQYINQLFPEQDFKIEWIDDTSLNVVYSSPDIATSAIQALSSNYIESLPLATLRPAKSTTEPKTIDGIKVRIAVMGDKKERGARDRSRWYLFNPHPSEEYDRRYPSPISTPSTLDLN
jgi:Nuclear cap-binding protein subunit 3